MKKLLIPALIGLSLVWTYLTLSNLFSVAEELTYTIGGAML